MSKTWEWMRGLEQLKELEQMEEELEQMEEELEQMEEELEQMEEELEKWPLNWILLMRYYSECALCVAIHLI